MKLSVIIVNYNKKEMLRDCLHSVLNKLHSVRSEIIVVDNASVDGSDEMLKKDFSNIKVILNLENIGFSAANNQGADVASGDYLFFLNNDTLLKNDNYFDLVTFMQENDAAICGLGLLNEDGTVQRQGSLLNKLVWSKSKPVRTSSVIGAALVISRKYFFDVGGWDEHYKFYNEDTDLCFSVRNIGKDVYYFPKCNVLHYGGVMAKYLSEFSIMEGYKGTLYFVKKHYGILAFHLYKFLIVIDLLLKLLVNVFRLLYDKNKKAIFIMIAAYKKVLFGLWR